MDVAHLRAGELEQSDGFAAAIEPHLQLLARVAGRIGPLGRREDVLQEALMRAWAHRRQYDSQKGPLLSWLLTIVANEARRAWGRRKFERGMVNPRVPSFWDAGSVGSMRFTQRDNRTRLHVPPIVTMKTE